MARTRKVEEQAVRSLLRPMGTLAVGATSAHPNLFPSGLGISQRDEPRNRYLGLVVTRPDPDTYVLGLNYFDGLDDCDNEDMFRLDTKALEITPYPGRSFENEYPAYAGHHWSTKRYLRKPEP